MIARQATAGMDVIFEPVHYRRLGELTPEGSCGPVVIPQGDEIIREAFESFREVCLPQLVSG